MRAASTAAGSAELRPVKPCARCSMVNVDPQTAGTGPQVLDLLQGYRQDARIDGAPSFGMNLITVTGDGQTLAVGQAVSATLPNGSLRSVRILSAAAPKSGALSISVPSRSNRTAWTLAKRLMRFCGKPAGN